jgi:WD40 repeat protein
LSMADISDISAEEIAHFEELIGVLRRRLRLLDIQLAKIAGNPSAVAQLSFEREEVEQQLRTALANLRRLRPTLISDQSPYLGLLTFQESNAHLFFGRDALIANLLERVRRSPFLAVLGASGSGKSSVVRAGLLPMLKGGALPGSESWRYITLKPGARPLDALAVELIKLQNAELSQALTLSQQLAENDRAFLLALDLLLDRAAGQRLVLMIDQFEELWTQMPLEEGARATFVSQQQRPFIERLLTALSAPDTPLVVVLTMRLDFLDEAADNPALAQAISEHNVIVSPMSPDELREMIVRPVELVGGDFEPGLVDELVEQGQRGALPLLEYTLAELWEERLPNGVMTWEAYRRLGGVEGALAARADALLHEHYTAEQQNELRQVLLRLVQPGEGVADTRRRVCLDELVLAGRSFEELYTLLKPLIDERLLTSGRDETNGEETIEVSHEALIRAWPTLGHWINEARVDLRFQLRLEEAAQEWEANNRNSELLWSGLRLSQAKEWLERAQPRLNARDQAFLDASREAERARIEAEEAARQHELAQAKARAEEQAAVSRRLRRQAIFLACAFVIALVAAAGAVRFGVEARRSSLVALARQLAAQAERDAASQPDRALLSGLQANRFVDELQTRGALLSVLRSNERLIGFLNGHTESVNSVAFSPDGTILASASDDGTIRLWDMASWQLLGEPLRGHTAPIWSVQFSPDGRTLASASDDASIRLWDVATRRSLGEPLLGHSEAVNSVAFSPDGKILVSGGGDFTIQFWDVATQQPLGGPLQGHEDEVFSVAFSPDGKTLASASWDKTIRLWDVASRQMIGEPLKGHTDAVLHMAFSPDGSILASASNDATVRLWNVAERQPIGEPLQGHTSFVRSVAFSPDGKTLASAGGNAIIRLWNVASQLPIDDPINSGNVWSIAFSPDGSTLASANSDTTIRLWDMASRRPLGEPLQVHDKPVRSVAVSSDGKMMATAGDDHTIRLWNTVNQQPIGGPLRGHTDTVWSVAFSPDGTILASGSEDATIRLWDVASRQPLGDPLQSHSGPVTSVAFSPDGTILASGSEDATIRLWDVDTWQPLGKPLQGHNEAVTSVAFSPDGKTLASASKDTTIRLWEVASQRPLGEPLQGHTDAVWSVAFSPDGKILASTGDDTTIRLWNVASRQSLGKPLRGHNGSLYTVAFSPDGSTLVSAGFNATISLWDVASRQALGKPLQGHTNSINSVVFTSDGMTLLSASNDTTIRLWEMSARSWGERACNIVRRNLSQDEWLQSIGSDHPYEQTCPLFPPGEGVSTK